MKDKLIYECYSENHCFIINDPEKEILFNPKLGKMFSVSPVNMLVQPVPS